jgi:hypothetical protein
MTTATTTARMPTAPTASPMPTAPTAYEINWLSKIKISGRRCDYTGIDEEKTIREIKRSREASAYGSGIVSKAEINCLACAVSLS